MRDDEFSDVLERLYRQAKAQFGTAIRSRWMYDQDDCPGCGGKIDMLKIKKQSTISLNAFIFRVHGVLIAYLLCSKCAKYIFKKAKKDPTGTTPLHLKIEEVLKNAFLKQLGH